MSLCRLFAFVFCLIPVSAPAQITHPWPVIDHQGFMNVIYAREFDRMEVIMAQTQEMMRKGTATPEDMRAKFLDFTTTNPKIIDFVEDWVAKYPESPYAHTAQAWVLYTIGSNVRGDKFIRDTYPDALEMHRQTFAEAYDHAQFAFAMENTLTPASDALIKLGLWLGRSDDAFDVVAHVMDIQPNWGTLRRAIDLASPSFGGSDTLAYAMCEHYGPLLDWPVENMVRYCIASANSTYFGNRWDDVRKWIKDESDPIWEYYRVQSLIGATPPTEDEAAYIVAYFKNSPVTNLRLAEKFDTYYSHLPGGEPIAQIVLARAKDNARETLLQDPNNLYALGVLLRPSYSVTVDENRRTSLRPIGIPTHEDALEYNRRRILASPYRSEYWVDYAQSLERLVSSGKTSPTALFSSDPLRINAIVYSNHNLDQVLGFFYRKIRQLRTLRDAKAWGPEWEEFAAVTDWHQMITCPLVQTMRLHDALVEGGSRARSYDGMDASFRDEAEALRAQAKQDGRCQAEETASVDTLYFAPVEVDLSVPEWVTADQ